MNAVSLSNVTKRYGNITALDSISLTVPKGQIYGLLGPNGAGKTTLIKILVGASRPTSGEVTVLDYHPIKNKSKLRQILGYMPQSIALYEDLSANDNVAFFAQVHNLQDIKKRVDEIVAFTELTTRANDPVKNFSGGMQKRVSLACSLIHNPNILILDEPTAAVDPYLKEKLWQLFRSLANEGTTIVISTHLMDEAMLCDQVAILSNGHLIIEDTPQHIIEKGKTILTIHNQGKDEKATIESTPEMLAEKLKEYGLHETIQSIELRVDNLETVLLELIKKDPSS